MLCLKPAFLNLCTILFAFSPLSSAQAQDKVYHRVVVTGGAEGNPAQQNNLERLRIFHSNLRKELDLPQPQTPGDIANLHEIEIGCVECGQLDNGTPRILVYYVGELGDGTNVLAFNKAWMSTLGTGPADGADFFAITFDRKVPRTSCAGLPPICGPRPACWGPPFNQCSRTISGPCQVCN